MRYKEDKVLSNGHSGWITCVAFNVNGTLVATAGLDGNICIWVTSTGAMRYIYATGHPILALIWADPQRILCGLGDGSITSIVINSDNESIDITGIWGHAFPVEHLTLHKNRLASGAQQELFIWKWDHNASLSRRDHQLDPPVIAQDIDEEIIITGVHWSGGNDNPSRLVVSYLYHGIHIVETQRWAVIQSFQVSGLVGSSSVSPDQMEIAVSNITSGFDVYDLSTGDLISSFEQSIIEKYPTPVLWIHGGNAIVGGSTSGKVNIWYVESGRKLVSLPIPNQGTVLAVAAYYDDETDSFLIATGAATAEDDKFSTTIWRAKDGTYSSDSDSLIVPSPHRLHADSISDGIPKWFWLALSLAAALLAATIRILFAIGDMDDNDGLEL